MDKYRTFVGKNPYWAVPYIPTKRLFRAIMKFGHCGSPVSGTHCARKSNNLLDLHQIVESWWLKILSITVMKTTEQIFTFDSQDHLTKWTSHDYFGHKSRKEKSRQWCNVRGIDPCVGLNKSACLWNKHQDRYQFGCRSMHGFMSSTKSWNWDGNN